MNRKDKLQSELDRILPLLVRDYRPEKIVLFGSLAWGDVHEWSDIDLVLLKRTRKPFLQRLKEVALLTKPKVGVDFFVYTPEEFSEMTSEPNTFQYSEMVQKGKVLYERT
jgi:uncharacterized protein